RRGRPWLAKRPEPYLYRRLPHLSIANYFILRKLRRLPMVSASPVAGHSAVRPSRFAEARARDFDASASAVRRSSPS
ncbi:MAG TPA: hypothetical protein PLM32_11740, partial [Candidatus Competibacter sp.]|nr:hypothetical protein [Candidatus Competibacter sp.]